MPIPPAPIPPAPPPISADPGDQDAVLRHIFRTVRSVAIVGLSPQPEKPSHYVPAYLQQRGYKILPINPGQAGGRLLGEAVVASLGDLGEVPDMVEIFRNAQAAGPLMAQAAAMGIKVIWLPLGVVNEDGAAAARAAGATVIMDRCPVLELPRLFPPDGIP